ncbi:hypothetical protein CSUI_002526 [Cystoisospora suis]|uniref:Uncharacterized protein n=1 Tax=Cystoisospora suis TaxID=483139 RepID=A0A2C6L8J2_9APIC|nr:hypothetical protein CSUI_002526 [Cystoisospora suis]
MFMQRYRSSLLSFSWRSLMTSLLSIKTLTSQNEERCKTLSIILQSIMRNRMQIFFTQMKREAACGRDLRVFLRRQILHNFLHSLELRRIKLLSMVFSKLKNFTSSSSTSSGAMSSSSSSPLSSSSSNLSRHAAGGSAYSRSFSAAAVGASRASARGKLWMRGQLEEIEETEKEEKDREMKGSPVFHRLRPSSSPGLLYRTKTLNETSEKDHERHLNRMIAEGCGVKQMEAENGEKIERDRILESERKDEKAYAREEKKLLYSDPRNNGDGTLSPYLSSVCTPDRIKEMSWPPSLQEKQGGDKPSDLLQASLLSTPLYPAGPRHATCPPLSPLFSSSSPLPLKEEESDFVEKKKKKEKKNKNTFLERQEKEDLSDLLPTANETAERLKHLVSLSENLISQYPSSPSSFDPSLLLLRSLGKGGKDKRKREGMSHDDDGEGHSGVTARVSGVRTPREMYEEGPLSPLHQRYPYAPSSLLHNLPLFSSNAEDSLEFLRFQKKKQSAFFPRKEEQESRSLHLFLNDFSSSSPPSVPPPSILPLPDHEESPPSLSLRQEDPSSSSSFSFSLPHTSYNLKTQGHLSFISSDENEDFKPPEDLQPSYPSLRRNSVIAKKKKARSASSASSPPPLLPPAILDFSSSSDQIEQQEEERADDGEDLYRNLEREREVEEERKQYMAMLRQAALPLPVDERNIPRNLLFTEKDKEEMDALVEALERQNSIMRVPNAFPSFPLHSPLELYGEKNLKTIKKKSQRQEERKDKFLGRIWNRRGEEELEGKRGRGGGFFMSTCSPASSPCSLFCCTSSSDTLASSTSPSSSSAGQGMRSRAVEKTPKNTKNVIDGNGRKETPSFSDKKEAEMIKSRGRSHQLREDSPGGKRWLSNVHFYEKPDDFALKERSPPHATSCSLSYYFPYRPWEERSEREDKHYKDRHPTVHGGISSTLPSITSLQDSRESKTSCPLPSSSSVAYMNAPLQNSANTLDHSSLPVHGKQRFLYPSPSYPLLSSSGTGLVRVPGKGGGGGAAGVAAAAEASPPGSLSPAVCTPGLPQGGGVGGRTLFFRTSRADIAPSSQTHGYLPPTYV